MNSILKRTLSLGLLIALIILSIGIYKIHLDDQFRLKKIFIEKMNHDIDSIKAKNVKVEKKFVRFEFNYKSNNYIAKVEKPENDGLKSINFEEMELPTPTFSNERFVNFNKTKSFLKMTITNRTTPTPPPGSKMKSKKIGDTTFLWYE